LVELHHGEISVESEPDRGTTFTICFPYGKNHLEQFETDDAAFVEDDVQLQEEFKYSEEDGKSEKAKKSSPLILIVEDNHDVRNYLRSCLENNYRILEAENGEKGFEKAIQKIPDLIISDVMMPGIDGFELCRKIKTDKSTSHIPFILLTGRASGESKIEGLETGADDYLIKPFDNKELLVRVKNLIRQRQKLRELFRKEILIEPRKISVTSMDEEFLQRVFDTIETYITDEDFSVENLSSEVGLSSSQLLRKIKALTDYSPNELINVMRLKRAASLIIKKHGTIAEICYDVGFSNPNYFTKCFRKQFGCPPSEYILKADK